MATRGEISLRDIAHEMTFFQSFTCFIFLKHLLSRTFDVNIAKLCNKIEFRELYYCSRYALDKICEIYTFDRGRRTHGRGTRDALGLGDVINKQDLNL